MVVKSVHIEAQPAASPLRRFAKLLPFVASFRQYLRMRQLSACSGVYTTFADAERECRKRGAAGYDREDAARLYVHTIGETRPSDYAAMFWLSRLLGESDSVFDFGGNVGRTYHSFRKYFDFPGTFQWVVCDLDKVVQEGRSLQAREIPAPNLTFTVDFSDACMSSIFLTCGTLQYVERPLPDLLASLDAMPQHVLINRIPLVDDTGFFTVQNIGPTSCAYQIFNRKQFIGSMVNLGYQLVDSWACPDSSCKVRYHQSRSVPFFSGLYFQLDREYTRKD